VIRTSIWSSELIYATREEKGHPHKNAQADRPREKKERDFPSSIPTQPQAAMKVREGKNRNARGFNQEREEDCRRSSTGKINLWVARNESASRSSYAKDLSCQGKGDKCRGGRGKKISSVRWERAQVKGKRIQSLVGSSLGKTGHHACGGPAEGCTVLGTQEEEMG